MVPFLFPSSMDSIDLNPLQRFIAKRELELEHKAVAPLERSAPLFVSGPVPAAVKYPGIRRLAYAGGQRQMDTAGGAIIAALAALVTIVIALAVFGWQ